MQPPVHPAGVAPPGWPTAEIVEPKTIRLISTAYIDEPAMLPLVDDAADLGILEQLEQQTSRRRDLDMPLPAGLKRSELLTDTHGYGWTLVNAAFCYTRPSGNRFNGPDRGAWYAAHGPHAAQTAQAEVAWHLTRELDAVGVYDNLTDYREILAGFIAVFADLRDPGRVTDDLAPCLAADPAIAYPAGQALARRLRQADVAGIAYPSVRRPGGQCLVAFRPNLVQNVRQGATWRFTWRGRREPSIARL